MRITGQINGIDVSIDDEHFQKAILEEQASILLEEAGLTNMTTMLVTTCVVCAIQGILAGSCLQLVYQYFYQPKRDPVLARLGVIMIIALSGFQVIICQVQMVRLLQTFERFTGGFLREWFLYQIQWLLFQFTLTPILLFFTHRAYVIWDRSKWVLFSCLFFIIPTFAMNTASASLGLFAPWGFKIQTNEEFAYWIPTYLAQLHSMYPLDLTGGLCHMIATMLLCFYICYGLFRHRNGYQQMDSAISRIIFLCGESLIPVVILAISFSIATFLVNKTYGAVLLRIIPPLAPIVYFHALMSSLVSRERVATILSAEPVRQMASISATKSGDGVGSKLDSGRSDEKFNLLNANGIEVQKINWTTLKAESGPSTYGVPDFVDLSKLSSNSYTYPAMQHLQTQSQTVVHVNKSPIPDYVLRRRGSAPSLPSHFGSRPVSTLGDLRGDAMSSEDTGRYGGGDVDDIERRRSSASMGLDEFLSKGPPV